MTGPELVAGWIAVPCGEAVVAELSINGSPWRAAFRDEVAGVRVAKLRPPDDLAGPVTVAVRLDGHVTRYPPVDL